MREGQALISKKSAQFAPWQEQVLRQLVEFLNLPKEPVEEWRARCPTILAYRAAVVLIADVGLVDLLAPLVAPDREGGIQFEWTKGKNSLEISVTRAGAYEYLLIKGSVSEENVADLSGVREKVVAFARS
jgi:hypothetical protein